MKELNCLGDMCPLPLMKLMKIMKSKPHETVKIITDHSCSAENIRDYCKKRNLRLEEYEPISGVWELIISNYKV